MTLPLRASGPPSLSTSSPAQIVTHEYPRSTSAQRGTPGGSGATGWIACSSAVPANSAASSVRWP